MIKRTVKYLFSRLGVFPYIDFFRRFPQLVGWISGGCSGIVPAPIKRKIILGYMRKYNLEYFIETGTHLGDTLAYVANNISYHCTSVELADEYYQEAKHRFKRYPNVTLLHGDSGALMPSVIKKLSGPALFWLDGHYSGGATAKGEVDTPVSAELRAILASSCKAHVILIDDARCFDGTNGYPHLDNLLQTVREQSSYSAEVSVDMIRLTPKAEACLS